MKKLISGYPKKPINKSKNFLEDKDTWFYVSEDGITVVAWIKIGNENKCVHLVIPWYKIIKSN